MSPVDSVILRCLFASTILIVGTTLNSFQDKEPMNINMRTLECYTVYLILFFLGTSCTSNKTS